MFLQFIDLLLSFEKFISLSYRCHGEKNNVVYEMAKDKNLLDNGTKNKGLGTMQNEDLTFLISLFGLERMYTLYNVRYYLVNFEKFSKMLILIKKDKK